MDKLDELLSIVTPQRSIDWEKIRLGRFTSSELHRLMSEPKKVADKEAGNLSEGAKTYVYEKIAERLTGTKNEVWAKPLEWGETYENDAREYYEAITGKVIQIVGFTPYGDNSGGSSDGQVDEDRIVEIKCPYESENHIVHLMLKTQDEFAKACPKYFIQVQANMFFAKRPYCDFISFDPRFDEKYRMKILPLEMDEKVIEQILNKLKKAEEFRNQILASL